VITTACAPLAAKSKQQKKQTAGEAQAPPSPSLKPSSFIDTIIVTLDNSTISKNRYEETPFRI
jgi:hypothetical protein